MPFFQNPFTNDFQANLYLHDKINSISYMCKANAGRGPNSVYAWNNEPYNLSGNDAAGNATKDLYIYFATNDLNFSNWSLLIVDISSGAVSTSAVKVSEIVTALNADARFSSLFTASPRSHYNEITKANQTTVEIKSNWSVERIKFYVVNGRAEEKLKFNARAGVAELPAFFSRHSFVNRNTYADSQGSLIQLDTANLVDAAVITSATDYKGKSLGYTTSAQADWQLLKGKSITFMFKKQTVNSNSQITEIIEYPAGAVVGDLAKKTTQTYTGTQTYPDKSVEYPYILQSGDLVTP